MFETGLQSDLVYVGDGSLLKSACVATSRDAECEWVDSELHEVMRAHSALDAREARCLRRAEQLQIWNKYGYSSMLQYLEHRLQYAPRTAYGRLRVARALGELREIEEALESGVLSHSIARELTRVATPTTQTAWLDRARGKSLREIEGLVSGRKKGDHPDDPTDPDLRTRKITFEMSPATYALFRQTQAALADEMGRRLEDDELVATMCRRSLEAPSGESGEPSVARYQIAVTTCETCKRGWQEAAGASIGIDTAAIEIAECDAQHIGSIDDAAPSRASRRVAGNAPVRLATGPWSLSSERLSVGPQPRRAPHRPPSRRGRSRGLQSSFAVLGVPRRTP